MVRVALPQPIGFIVCAKGRMGVPFLGLLLSFSPSPTRTVSEGFYSL